MNASLNPADIASAVALASAPEIRAKRRTKKADDRDRQHPRPNEMSPAVSLPKARASAIPYPHPSKNVPCSGLPNAEVEANIPARPFTGTPDFGNPIHGDEASDRAHHINMSPVAVAPDCPPTYEPTDAVSQVIADICNNHKLRQGMIRAKNRIVLQGMAVIRIAIHQPSDYESEATKKALRERADAVYREAAKDPDHEFYPDIEPYLLAGAPLDAAADAYAKRLAKLAKLLPVYPYVKSVKGFGDVSFATIVGEAGDIGTYKSAAALWKRMGLAVIGGKAQGKPGAGATAEDWIEHGYCAPRRSVMWNARAGLILGMGKWRPVFGEDVWENPEYTYFQKVFASRARLECEKLGKPVKASDKGKDSYCAHAANRALRYVEKRLLKHLRQQWRKSALAENYAPVAEAA